MVARVRAGIAALPDVDILTPANPELSASMISFRTPRIAYNKLFGRLLGEHRLRCRPVSEQKLDAVRVSLHNLSHQALIPLVPLRLTLPPFATTQRKEFMNSTGNEVCE